MFTNKENIKNTGAAGEGRLANAFFQPKLTVNQPNDIYEQEADQMADKVMRMADPSLNQNAFFKPAINRVQRKCQACEEEDKHVHRKESGESDVKGSNGLDSYVSSLHSSGQSMPDNSRKFFEPKFGHDFSNVKLHTDSAAAKSAQSINALAYTSGNNIVFNAGQYSPDSDNGKKLMAHELTHVVQQGKDTVRRYGHDKYCDTEKHLKPFIWPGHYEAIRMLTNALNAFNSKAPSLNTWIPKYFGTEGLSHISEIEARFRTIFNKVNENYMYHCNDSENKNSDALKCHGQRAGTDITGLWPSYDITFCFDKIDNSYTAADIGALIIHENYHRAFGGSSHPWGLSGKPNCDEGKPEEMTLLLDNPDSYACMARKY
jgi:hypothetical protein